MKPRDLAQGVAGAIILFGLVQAGGAADHEAARRLQLHLGPLTGVATSPGRIAKEPPKAHAVSLKKQARLETTPSRPRRPEMSWQHLVAVALDDRGREIDRVIAVDPRLIRYESADPSGQFVASEVLYREEADLTVAFRDHPEFRAVRVYHPRWTGKDYVLDLLGETRVP